jgi:two-component system KDP operon response regulator KdpE
VLEAATGQAALDRTALENPDVIVLDLGLPDMDGVER